VARQISEAGNTTLELRRHLAAKFTRRTAAYDAAIAAHLQKEFSADKTALPQCSRFRRRCATLRYGENPHQKAALYGSLANISSSCTARSFLITTSWISRRPRL